MSVHACVCVCVQVCKDITYLHVDKGGKRTFICAEEGTEAREEHNGLGQWSRGLRS